jgi:putative transposase
MGRRLFQSERNAMLLIEVLRSYVAMRKFILDDFVVMPDHLHPLMTVHGDMTIERSCSSSRANSPIGSSENSSK